MQNRYFGRPWGPAAHDRALMVSVPIGMVCFVCEELIAHGDSGLFTWVVDVQGKASQRPQHRECFLRGILGSVGHQQGRCACFGGTEEDPPGMSKREAAIAAVAHAKL